MSRALAAAIALAAVVSLAPPPGPLAGSQARGADCTWQRHSKRIVKHVRRDGKPRRVTRVRRWWSCDQAAVPPLGPAPVVAPAPGPAPAPAPEPESEAAPNRVGVKAVEYSYTLSRPSVLAGEITIELNNQGQDPHNLHLEREGAGEPPLEIAEVGPKESRAAHFELPAGEYRLWCSLENHDSWGMNSTLLVAAG